ncbi:MAG: secretion system protein E, partial [Thermoplasmata archaeon]|nr:secretion system protein E [Thermoplasmata archaeon]
TTFHADDVQAMVHRLENDPINLPRALVAALDIVLLQAQVKVGTDMTRRVKAIVEVVGTDPESNELITNSAYTWNPADDTFNYSGHSYVYEKISLARNWNQRRMEQEVKRRLDLFDYMKRMEIKNYRDVAKIVSSYYKDPDGMIKIVRDTLQAQGVAVPAS